jgi:hypothetical protein
MVPLEKGRLDRADLMLLLFLLLLLSLLLLMLTKRCKLAAVLRSVPINRWCTIVLLLVAFYLQSWP